MGDVHTLFVLNSALPESNSPANSLSNLYEAPTCTNSKVSEAHDAIVDVDAMMTVVAHSGINVYQMAYTMLSA